MEAVRERGADHGDPDDVPRLLREELPGTVLAVLVDASVESVPLEAPKVSSIPACATAVRQPVAVEPDERPAGLEERPGGLAVLRVWELQAEVVWLAFAARLAGPDARWPRLQARCQSLRGTLRQLDALGARPVASDAAAAALADPAAAPRGPGPRRPDGCGALKPSDHEFTRSMRLAHEIRRLLRRGL